MTDAVEWTPEGRAALVAESTWGPTSLRDLDRAALLAKIDESFARYAPCWERGVTATNREGTPRADDLGRAVAAHAKTWIGSTSSSSQRANENDAAGVLSLVGARSDGHDSHVAELLLRDHGIAFMVRVLVRMWSMATSYDDPDWPDSEKRLAIWLWSISDASDASSVNDASVSYAKGHLASYLATRVRGHEAERAELLAAIDAAWAAAPLYARPALAVASDDTAYAERAMREIFAANPPWYAHYARGHLPNLISDRALLERLGFVKEARPRLRWLERMGIAALPIYEAMYASKLTKHQREYLTKQIVNIRGPSVAKLLAPYAEKAPFAADIRAYFTRAPELLVIARKDKKLAPHYAQLDKLAAKIAPKGEKPVKAAKAETAAKTKAKRPR